VQDPVPANSAFQNTCGMSEVVPRSGSSQDHEHGRGSCFSKFDDFLGSVPIDLTPSAPPLLPEAAAPSAPPLPAEAAAQALAEVQLDSTDLARFPNDDFGALAIFCAPWRPQHVLLRRPFVLVLQHPSDATHGMRLFESYDREEVTAAAHAVIDTLGLQDGSHVPEDIYLVLLSDLELQAAVVAACSEEVQQPQAHAELPSSELVGTTTASASSANCTNPEVICNDCPICFSEIEPGDAAMRCAGAGGHHHYFHSGCMLRWVEQCRSGLSSVTCPICRGQMQFHAQRLKQFLSGAQSAGLASEDRTFLQQCADRLRATGDTAWGDVFTLENAKHVGGLVAAGGWGFMLGYTQPPPCLHQSLILDGLPQQHRIAQGAGWVIGLIVRLVREHRREKRGHEQGDRDCPR